MGKVFVDLSHPFGADIPLWPYFTKPVVDTMHGQAKSGVLSQKITVVMHSGTHADAPRHVMERDFNGVRARYSHELPVDAYVGDAVCLDIKIEDWGLIKGEHLDDACERANIKPEELKKAKAASPQSSSLTIQGSETDDMYRNLDFLNAANTPQKMIEAFQQFDEDKLAAGLAALLKQVKRRRPQKRYSWRCASFA